ncbi:hypothetical protein RvY_08152-2 [Ramazzottius varieornatus]|uniref:Uncharacterized protein n=1 Tax=Ramazzottius varieornatus TaxID=947166 RepID=A0A1D1V7K2_RAMVA|nr:hypothetical protein RvY_08152-2 [Ramazzottius varieornatus]
MAVARKEEVYSMTEGKPEELATPEAGGKNWKGVLIALCVIAVICALVIMAIALLAPTVETYHRDGQPLTLYDITDGSLSPSYKEVQWLSDKELLYQSDTNNSIIVHNLQNKTTSILLDLKASERIDSYKLAPSAERRFLLYTKDTRKVYRHTTKASYRIHDLDNHQWLNASLIISPFDDHRPLLLQYATWAPSTVEHKLVFVHENDIYYQKLSQEGLLENAVRLTDTGATDQNPRNGTEVIYNGIPDWLYEEEILSSDHAVWWSPDSKYLAYLSFNDTEVQTFAFDTYGYDANPAKQYSNSTKIRYPKAGTKNPAVALYIVDPEAVSRTRRVPGEGRRVEEPQEVKEFGEWYITTVTWLAPDKLFVRWTNRYQNISILASCPASTLTCTKIYRLESREGWLEDSPPFPLDDGAKIVMLSGNHADQRQHQTVCRFSTTSASFDMNCVNTNFDITEILAVQSNTNKEETIYALAAYDAPRNRHIIRITGNDVKCLTCNLTRNCTYYDDVRFSHGENPDYIVVTCRGPNVPYTQVWQLSHLLSGDADLKEVHEVRGNKKVQNQVDVKAIPHRKYLEVELKSLVNGPKAQVELLLPPKFTGHANKRYSLLIRVYGGPGSQEVHSRYRMDFEEYLASSQEVVIARIDGRGSGYQGFRMKYEVNRNLGFNEVKDQLEVAQYLLDNHQYLDPARVGIWGWSYGGYATARAVLLDNAPQVIRCAASVAPVTDWKLYDTAYTERFMSTPEDNPKAYENSNLMPYSTDSLYWHFARTSFLLVHGTADDNVHFQQAAQFTKALMKADILFKTQIYPDEDHSIRRLRFHLYHTLQEHFLTCFEREAQHDKDDD